MSDQPQSANDPIGAAWDIQMHAARMGFDWPEISPVFEKIHEEIGEIKAALSEQRPDHARRELGDLLFAVVNLSRFLNADPGRELTHASQRFLERFAKMKKELERAGRAIEDCSLEEMDQAWNRVKAAE
ncbi:MAG TPA: MazG nucleotide pyrophosphohydrolase domain-containing protein [Candidatus Hydrogenedentes bacterium]|nr:MazG nucleotide pyrophosphohydrolase domain-containing protein [Candidatus Hydrogenedentota bacterium]HQM47040.1 MazG nucleotide pyrophosphohydrolase domain-containing protein [Candidatus Hydrogenedentota bacterium]